MLDALTSNGALVQAMNLFAYANQSLFSGPIDVPIDPYLIRDQSISTFEPPVNQLMPSSLISGLNMSNLYPNYIPLVSQRLAKLTDIFKEFADFRLSSSKIEGQSTLLSVVFLCFEYPSSQEK